MTPHAGSTAVDTHVQVGVLGPIVIRNAAVEIPINGPRQRDLLAVLAIQPGRLVPADTLVDQVWPSDPPPTAGAAMRVHLARLRKILGELSAGAALLVFQPPGYRLHESVGTDAAEFERRLATARQHAAAGTLRAALQEFDQALALWRGRALAGVVGVEAVRAESERLESLLLDADEERTEVRLALGHHQPLCTILTDAVAHAPLRERRTAQLMLALHRSGRQADALKASRLLRRLLVDELGVDPGTEVQRLEGAILRNEPGLRWSAATGGDPAAVSVVRPERSTPTAIAAPDAAEPRLQVPPLVRALVTERMARLGPRAVRLVRCLVLLDGESTVEVLAAALDESTVETERLLEEVYAVGGLLNRVAAPGSIALQHRQFAAAIRDELPAADVGALHLAVGSALRRIAPADGPQRVAMHLLAAGPHVPIEQVISAVILGADEALRLEDVDEAAALAGRGLTALGGRPGLEHASIDLLLRVVAADSRRGRVELAQEHWNRALDLSRRTDDAERFALVVLAHDWSQQMIGEDGGDRELLGEALDRLPPAPSALRVRIGSALLTETMLPGRLTDATELAEQVRAGALAVGDDESLLAAMSAQQVLLRRLPIEPALRELTAELNTTADRHGAAFWRSSVDLAVLFLALREGTGPEIDAALDNLRKRAVRAASGRLSWALSLSECTVAGMRGQWQRADQFADEAAALGAAAGISDALHATLINRFLTDFHVSSVAPHAPILGALTQAFPGFSLVRAGAALALTQAGETEAATGCIDALVDHLRTQPADEALMMSAALAVEAAVRLPDGPESTGLRTALGELLAPYAAEFVVFGQIAGVFGPVRRHLALLAAAAGDADAALAGLRAARRQSTAANSPVWVVRCATDEVQLLRSLGRDDEAAELAARVRPRAESLGVVAHVRDLDAVQPAADAGGSSSAGRPAGGSAGRSAGGSSGG